MSCLPITESYRTSLSSCSYLNPAGSAVLITVSCFSCTTIVILNIRLSILLPCHPCYNNASHYHYRCPQSMSVCSLCSKRKKTVFFKTAVKLASLLPFHIYVNLLLRLRQIISKNIAPSALVWTCK